MLPASIETVARACKAMVAAASEPCAEANVPAWECVKRMQGTSYYHLLLLLIEGTETRSVECLFDDDVCDGSAENKGCARKLRRGEHLPTMKTLARNALRLARLRGEDYLLRLQADCYQLLWLALLMDRPIGERADDYVRVHDWYDMELAFGVLRVLGGSYPHHYLTLPSSRASLPTLAGLVVTLRRAVELRRASDAHLIATGICRQLLILGVELQRRGIAAPLFRYFEEHVLPLGGLDVSATQLARASAFVNLLAMSTPPLAESLAVEWPTRVEMMVAILDGDFGAALQQLCDPLQTPKSRTQWKTLSVGQQPLLRTRRSWRPPPCENVSIESLLRIDRQAEYWIIPQAPVKSPRRMRSWCEGLLRA